MKALLSLLLVALLAAPTLAQEPERKTGYVPSPFAKQLKAASAAAHGPMLKELQADPLPAHYEAPHQIPQQNQGNCGSCWDVSACRAASSAFIGAGFGKADGSFVLSADTVMWCYSTGGCSGDDASTVFRILKRDGLPINADVGEYRATGRGPCNKTAKRYLLDDWGYTDSNGDGITDYGEWKAAIYKFGPCVLTCDAGALVNGEQVSTYRGRGTNHQIIVVGWEDVAGKAATKRHTATIGGVEHVYEPSEAADYQGVLICVNQWGPWGYEHNGQRGFCKLAAFKNGHIAASGSSEGLWCKVEGSTPPVPPTPPEPPVPPVPPVPPASTVTFTIRAYTFTVAGWFSSQKVTIPAQVITANLNAPKADCEDCGGEASGAEPSVVVEHNYGVMLMVGLLVAGLAAFVAIQNHRPKA